VSSIREFLLMTIRHVGRYFDVWEWAAKKQRYRGAVLTADYEKVDK
jgi:hypothetical protein